MSTVSDGEAAVAIAVADRPDLIILDIMMPGIDGIEACRRIRANAATAQTPVLMFSALSEEAEAARHAGHAVESLEYEALEPLVRRVWEAIADDVAARFGVRRLAIAHRTGDVPLGEASVIVVAAAPHRDAAFAAARHAMDETKARAPIWKAERFADGHVWIGEPARTDSPKERHG